MHHRIEEAFERIDAALFNGDTFDEPEDREALMGYLERWHKHLKNKAVYERAAALGCDPEWADGILGWAWHCTCPDNRHGSDQQCSAITPGSLIRDTNRAKRDGAP